MGKITIFAQIYLWVMYIYTNISEAYNSYR
nr:MAG TPA: hypothetical protein [Caudoviricetes sp.]